MAQGKRISAEIGGDALHAIKAMGAAAKLARSAAGEGQSAAAARLGVHVQTIGRIESGEPGVAIGHVLGLLALYGVTVRLQLPDAGAPAS
ncbi:helix-turn-helix domain-containing protein [Ramlibacter tataouinensis]|uniref:helix-turn-helix domain-containing protein n=1 Tax=Ramlibacter tataouinensis TaxID=94132 RepID=UPI00077812A2|nr:helix-turn-helix transcriptional regulator [Ramlibacter tataouinensis]